CPKGARSMGEICPWIGRYYRGRGRITENGARASRSQVSNCSIAIAARDVVVWVVVPCIVTDSDIVSGARRDENAGTRIRCATVAVDSITRTHSYSGPIRIAYVADEVAAISCPNTNPKGI